jgi:hypothetical protein
LGEDIMDVSGCLHDCSKLVIAYQSFSLEHPYVVKSTTSGSTRYTLKSLQHPIGNHIFEPHMEHENSCCNARNSNPGLLHGFHICGILILKHAGFLAPSS